MTLCPKLNVLDWGILGVCDALVTHCYRRENPIVTREATIWGLEIRGNYVLGGPTPTRQGLHTNTVPQSLTINVTL